MTAFEAIRDQPGNLKRYSLTEQIAEWLSHRIISGEYPPKAPLLETEIAETLGCSRSPVREALRILAQEGLVDISPGKGATVSPLDPATAADFYDTRALLESHATLLAAQVMTEEEIEKLSSIFADLEDAEAKGDMSRYHQRNWEFHTTLYGFCPNHTIIDLIRLIWRRSLRHGQLQKRDPARARGSLERKRALLELIKKRDAVGAAKAMEQLVLSGKNDVLKTLEENASGS